MALIITYIFVGISLSMDAFSLSMVYGTLSLEKKMIRFLSILVGVFHFFMPLLGVFIGEYVISSFIPNPDKLVGIIFIILGLQMIFSINELSRTTATSFKNLGQALLFAFSVSLDSFSIGIGLGAAGTSYHNQLIAILIFSICSATFTFLGLQLGKKLSLKFGKIANIIGSILLLILGLKSFL